MSSLNMVLLIGNLGKDPEIKETEGGKTFAKLSLATSEKYKGESKTTWHSITVWDEKKAEILEEYCKKGSKLFIQGKLEKREYTDKEGIERTAYEIVVGAFEGAIRMLDSRKDDDNGERAERSKTRSTAKPKTTTKPGKIIDVGDAELDDEVPW